MEVFELSEEDAIRSLRGRKPLWADIQPNGVVVFGIALGELTERRERMNDSFRHVTVNCHSTDRTPSSPRVVIHGLDDALINPTGGRRTAELIPGAVLVEVADMGHDLPEPLWPQIVEAITSVSLRS